MEILAAHDEQLVVDQQDFGVHAPIEVAELNVLFQAATCQLIMQDADGDGVLDAVHIDIRDQDAHGHLVLLDGIHQGAHPLQGIVEVAHIGEDGTQGALQLQ